MDRCLGFDVFQNQTNLFTKFGAVSVTMCRYGVFDSSFEYFFLCAFNTESATFVARVESAIDGFPAFSHKESPVRYFVFDKDFASSILCWIDSATSDFGGTFLSTRDQ